VIAQDGSVGHLVIQRLVKDLVRGLLLERGGGVERVDGCLTYMCEDCKQYKQFAAVKVGQRQVIVVSYLDMMRDMGTHHDHHVRGGSQYVEVVDGAEGSWIGAHRHAPPHSSGIRQATKIVVFEHPQHHVVRGPSVVAQEYVGQVALHPEVQIRRGGQMKESTARITARAHMTYSPVICPRYGHYPHPQPPTE